MENMVSSQSHSYENLLAGSAQVVSEAVTLKTGQVYLCGSVIGLATADNKGDLVDSAATDGTEEPYGILSADVDATAADATGVLYLSGEFSESKLIVGGSDTIGTHKRALRKIGIYVRKTKN